MPATPLLLLLALALSLSTAGCTNFDSPPVAYLLGNEGGILPDPSAPLVLGFHEAVKPETLSVKVVRYETDGEGNLLDFVPCFEPAEGPDQREPIFAYDNRGANEDFCGGQATWREDNRVLTLSLTSTLPIGPQLAVVVEAGLSDEQGNTWKVDQILKFGFEFDCAGDGLGSPTTFPDQVQFMLVDVDSPIQTQLQLIGAMRVNPDTGAIVGQFTNGDRDPSIDCSKYELSCASNEVCRTLPSPECVEPSTKAVTPDEYPDYVANDVLPTGYSFTVLACVRDEPDGSYVFSNAPVDVEVISPPVTVVGINLNGSFAYDDQGVLGGDGTFVAAQVLLGTSPSGVGVGTITMREIPPDEVKPSTPWPPEQ